jgi:hypothetical protein
MVINMAHGLSKRYGSKTRVKRKKKMKGGTKIKGKNPKKSYKR